MRKTIFQFKKTLEQEYFLRFKYQGNHYATLHWFGIKRAQKKAKRDQNKRLSTHVFVAT